VGVAGKSWSARGGLNQAMFGAMGVGEVVGGSSKTACQMRLNAFSSVSAAVGSDVPEHHYDVARRTPPWLEHAETGDDEKSQLSRHL